MPRPTVAEIHLSAILDNLRVLRGLVGPAVDVIGIVKADAYGHGAVEVARALERAGVTRFAVALVEEAVALRDAGIRGKMLILGAPLPDQADELAAQGFEVVVSEAAFARCLNEAARRRQRTVGVHLKFDIGMGRVGFNPGRAVEVAGEILALPHLRIEGAMTHFPVADERTGAGVTRDQIEAFRAVRDQLGAAGIAVPLWHCANSGAVLLHPAAHLDAVRPGIALYGGFDPRETPPGVTLRQALTLKTRIAQVRDLPAGATVSYGCTFRTARPTRLAVLPLGYADGLNRGLSNRGQVLIRGRRAPIVGRVCMDLTLVDVTEMPEAAPGDEVVLYGRQGAAEIPLTDVARALGTISYELMTTLTARVPRVYVR